jgi:hypothetical protein
MLWNWYTVDSCFIASSWHITSKGMFAGSCIGVILLVMALEFLRRSVKEYDRYLIRTHMVAHADKATGSPVPVAGFRPNVFQQAVRAFLHMVQFAVAYFIMLYVSRPCPAMSLYGEISANSPGPQTRHVLQRVHHHLYLHRRLSGQFRVPLGNYWKVSVSTIDS